MKKQNFTQLVSLFLIAISFTSCSNDDDQMPVSNNVETKTFSNLFAPQTGGAGEPTGGPFTKFSFSQESIVTDDSWDIAFRGTTIIVNGGDEIGISDEPSRTGIAAISIVTGTFESVAQIPDETTFLQDGANLYAIPTGSGNGWYNYNPANNLITPIAGKVFVVKTHDGKYAKFEIISYYENAPSNPNPTDNSRYFTFNYSYQPEGTTF